MTNLFWNSRLMVMQGTQFFSKIDSFSRCYASFQPENRHHTKRCKLNSSSSKLSLKLKFIINPHAPSNNHPQNDQNDCYNTFLKIGVQSTRHIQKLWLKIFKTVLLLYYVLSKIPSDRVLENSNIEYDQNCLENCLDHARFCS